MFKTLLADFKRISNIDWRWLLIWLLIYDCFLLLDIFDPRFIGAMLIKYLGIILCVVYAYQKFRADTLLTLALLFTVLADAILVWTPFYVPGVYCFCFAQFFHIARLARTHPKALIGFFFIVFTVFLAGVLQGIEPIFVIAFIYAVTLSLNLTLAILWHRRSPSSFRARCACYGFALFVACDICVALQFLAREHLITGIILPIVSYLVWFFYYPSQILISNSSNTKLPKKAN